MLNDNLINICSDSSNSSSDDYYNSQENYEDMGDGLIYSDYDYSDESDYGDDGNIICYHCKKEEATELKYHNNMFIYSCDKCNIRFETCDMDYQYLRYEEE